MLSKRTDNNRNQLEMVALDQLVPEDHLVRKIEQAIDFDFINDLVKDTYCLDNGRPSIDPVVLIKMVFVQYLFGIRSMRQTIKEIETNVAYRWFLGYGFTEKIPQDRKSTRLNSSHVKISYAVFCLKKKKTNII